MLSFIRKKNSDEPASEKQPARPAEQKPAAEERPKGGRQVTPGVQMLKEVWHIDTHKKKKEIAPPGIPTDIYCVPKQRQMPPRHGSGT